MTARAKVIIAKTTAFWNIIIDITTVSTNDAITPSAKNGTILTRPPLADASFLTVFCCFGKEMLKNPDCFSRKYRENDKKGRQRQPFCFYFMRFGETQSKDQSTTGIISSEQLRQQQPEKQRPEQQQRLQSQQNRFRGCLCCHRLCHRWWSCIC